MSGGLPMDPISMMSVGIAGLLVVACVGAFCYYAIWVKLIAPVWDQIMEKALVPCWAFTRRRVIKPCRRGTEACLSSMCVGKPVCLS